MPILSTLLLLVGGFIVLSIVAPISTPKELWAICFGVFLVYCGGVVNDE